MAYLKNIQVQNGTTLYYHRVVGLEVNPNSDVSTIRINSWMSEEDYLLGKPNVWSQNVTEPGITRFLEEITGMVQDSTVFANAIAVEDVPELDKLRLQKILRLKHARDVLEYSGFQSGSNIYDSDLVSQSRIQGGVLKALVMLQKQDTSNIYWTLKNNAVATLTPLEMLQVGEDLYSHVQNSHGLYRAAKLLVMQATTAEEIEEVQLNG
jgi:hypothetical protein